MNRRRFVLGRTGEAEVLLTFDDTAAHAASGKVTGERTGEFKRAMKD